MLKNYFKTAWRNLLRNKSYATVNIIGLGLGMASSILIFILVSYHFSFDNFHKNKDRIFRVVTELHQDGISYTPGVPPPFTKAFRSDYTFFEKVGRVVTFENSLISIHEGGKSKKFQEESGVAFAEPEILEIFNFPLLEGNPKTVLSEPNSAIITEKLAKKYFSKVSAMGKLIQIDNKSFFKITGILKNLPINTDRNQEIYLSDYNIKEYNDFFSDKNAWTGINSETHCFFRLKEGIKIQQVENIFPSMKKKYYKDERSINQFQFKIQALSDIHFNPDLNGYVDKKYLWALILVAIFLMISSCVNFINLATAQAMNRSKEIGIRKVIGSLRSQIFWQFMLETTLITLFGAVLSILLVEIGLPLVNGLFKKELSLSLFSNIYLFPFLIILIGVVIFLSGAYPGLVLSRFLPIEAIKGKISQKNVGGISLRRILVIVQFAISQILIIAILVIARQMNYSKNSDLGFTKDALVMIPIPIQDSSGKVPMELLKYKLSQISGIEKISFCYEPPASTSNNLNNLRYDRRDKDELFPINVKPGDAEYLSTFKLKLVAGRNFYPSDTVREYLVNEALIKKLNLTNPKDILNKNISVNGKSYPVVGVVQDFYNLSFRGEKQPLCIYPSRSAFGSCALKINLSNTKNTLRQIENIWNKIYPEYFYSYQFLDEKVARFYELDDIILKLIEAFAVIAIVIGCLGLYGLVSFFAQNKIKEIGIRKVLGAGIQSIIWLFGKEFLRLVLISFVLAAPIAWLASYQYLLDFQYRVPIGIGVFIITILITLIIVSITVGYKSLRAATANPIKSIRTE